MFHSDNQWKDLTILHAVGWGTAPSCYELNQAHRKLITRCCILYSLGFMADKVKFGIIGTGAIAAMHAEALKDAKNAEKEAIS